MTTEIVTTTDNDAADEISTLWKSIAAAFGDAYRTSLPKAIRIGEVLKEQKQRLGHGAFLPWVRTALPFDERTAQRYMQLYKRRATLKSVSVTDLTSAYRALVAPKKSVVVATPEPEPEPGRQRFVPPAGHGLVFKFKGWANARMVIQPYKLDPRYYFIAIVTDDPYGVTGGTAFGNRRAFNGDRLDEIVEDMLRDEHLPVPDDDDGTTFESDGWTYNEFLFESHDDYVQMSVLGRVRHPVTHQWVRPDEVPELWGQA